MNRDYFAKPIQGSRSATEYGHTHLEDRAPPMTGFAIATPIGILFMVLAFFNWG